MAIIEMERKGTVSVLKDHTNKVYSTVGGCGLGDIITQQIISKVIEEEGFTYSIQVERDFIGRCYMGYNNCSNCEEEKMTHCYQIDKEIVCTACYNEWRELDVHA